MGKRDKKKKFEFEDDEDDIQDGKDWSSKSIISLSSDDDEANEDLSLKIVEKALRLRSGKLVTVAGDNKGGVEAGDNKGGVEAGEVFSSSLEFADAVSGNCGASVDDITAASEVPELGSKKTAKRRKKKVKKLGSEERDVVVIEEQKIETTGMIDQVDSMDPNSTEETNNVFRKLLRGPRYFDPPDSWGTCYNCGEEGHNAVNCKSAKRKKPCFVCGSLEHNARSCEKARDCYICKKVGHRAKDCQEKHRDASSNSTICLKCGDPGHDMFSCRNLYPNDDLKSIQCYICKEFGHLCCVKSTIDTSIDISCYKCGQTGHTGLACSRLRGEGYAAVPHSSCYRCGEEGHFARECTSSTKSGKGILEEASGAASTSSCYRCGEQGHFARECNSSNKGGKRNRELSNPKLRSQIEETNHMGSKSVPLDVAKAKKKKINHEEKYSDSPRKSGQKGRWMMEDPGSGNFSHGKSMRNNWNSPGTPSRRDHNYYTEYTDHYESPRFSGHYASPRSSGHYTSPQSFTKRRTLHPETPMSLASSKASHNRFSASRFGGFSNEGRRKSYGWW